MVQQLSAMTDIAVSPSREPYVQGAL